MKYYIKTFGCQMNVSDSERIAGFLETLPLSSSPLIKGKGLILAKRIEEADLVIFNTCGVRQTAEDRVYGQVHNLATRNVKRRTKKPIIVLTGCLANRKDVRRRLKDKVDLFLEIKNIVGADLASALGLKKKQIPKFGQTQGLSLQNNYLSISPKYTNQKTAFVPIMTGCNNFCSYCVVPFARGREISRPAEEIFSEIEKLAKNGCQEITLLGQNVNSYSFIPSLPSSLPSMGERGLDFPSLPSGEMSRRNRRDREGTTITFPALLNLLAKSYPKIAFRFLTSHPKDFSENLMRVIAQNKNISREIHLPIQSGSDKILKLMNRPYTQKHYLKLIKQARKIIPGVSFTTDVIVGFPGETEKDFQETVRVFQEVKFNLAYINKYSPRPGTAAEKLGDPISWEEKKRRERFLRSLLN